MVNRFIILSLLLALNCAPRYEYIRQGEVKNRKVKIHHTFLFDYIGFKKILKPEEECERGETIIYYTESATNLFYRTLGYLYFLVGMGLTYLLYTPMTFEIGCGIENE